MDPPGLIGNIKEKNKANLKNLVYIYTCKQTFV